MARKLIPVGSTMQGWTGSEGIRHLDRKLTTGVALGLAIESCRKAARRVYRDHGCERLGQFQGVLRVPGGQIPAIAFPLQLAVITAEDVVRYEVGLPGGITAEDLDAARTVQAAIA
ncbi:MAG TPA: hypothetical protein VGR87_03895 [Candidatus Limnocylindria bacterium]|jgi:hypothetical protein|nr:hypothetical protein [Candidatus Limnocylindria bacterium]